jgi:hypothetical protein
VGWSHSIRWKVYGRQQVGFFKSQVLVGRIGGFLQTDVWGLERAFVGLQSSQLRQG